MMASCFLYDRYKLWSVRGQREVLEGLHKCVVGFRSSKGRAQDTIVVISRAIDIIRNTLRGSVSVLDARISRHGGLQSGFDQQPL